MELDIWYHIQALKLGGQKDDETVMRPSGSIRRISEEGFENAREKLTDEKGRR